LLAAVLAEREARGDKKLPADEASREKPGKEAAPSMPQGKLNAVRAAFKAGVTPSRIARQFGISQSDVRKALASYEAKRRSRCYCKARSCTPLDDDLLT
jgi:DNA invertase Pin-like site-specific DNA recombinase